MSANNNDNRGARALFDAQVDALDGPTATALRTRRREALAAAHDPRRTPWWWPASGVATAALALALWLPSDDGLGERADDALARTTAATPADQGPTPIAAARFADSALGELEEDAEFYAWLATVPPDDTDTTALPVQGPQEGWTL